MPKGVGPGNAITTRDLQEGGRQHPEKGGFVKKPLGKGAKPK